MPKTIKEPRPTNTLQYEQCGNYILVKTPKKFGVVHVDEFNKCELNYNKILKKINESKVFIATDELLEHYSKYGFFGVWDGCNCWEKDSSYIHFGKEFNADIYVTNLQGAINKYKTSGYRNFVIKNGDMLVGVENNKILKRPVQINDYYYECVFSDFSKFALQEDSMVPLYTDPESRNDWNDFCQYEYLEEHDLKTSNLEIIFYYPTDDEWDEFLKSDEDEVDFFVSIIDIKFNEWLTSYDSEAIKKQAISNFKKIKDKIIKLLAKDYELNYEDNNKIVVDLEPHKIMITINERL